MRKPPQELVDLVSPRLSEEEQAEFLALLTLYASQVYADAYDAGERDGAMQHHEEYCTDWKD